MNQATNDTEIRPLAASDAPALGAFFKTLGRDSETARFFHPHPLTMPFAADLCARLTAMKDRYYVATSGGEVVGYAMLRGWDEGYSVPSFGACVHPACRNAGLGKRLMAFCIEQSKLAGADKLRLTVFKSNERAVAVYRKFGFAFTDKNADEYVGVLPLKVAA